MIYKKNEPLVSIIMNCFNGERYLHQAIKSILAQSYQNWEIVFWDNKSMDNSEKIFKSYYDNRFRYYRSGRHTILYEARNYALSKCNGEFIAFLDVDDIWFPKKLSIQISLFKDFAVGLCCGNYIKINERKKNDISTKPRYHSLPHGNVLNDIFQDYFVHISTLMIRKQALSQLEYFFDSRFKHLGDLDIVIRLCSKWKLASVQELIASYRWHQNNNGYKDVEALSDDFNILFNKIKNNKKYRKLSNFSIFEDKVKLYNVLKLLYVGKKTEALSKINSLKIKHSLKILIAIFLPTKLIKMWIDRP